MAADMEPAETIRRDFLKSLFSGRRKMFTLQMAPMIDIIFLLLIFFLVAAKWRPQENFLPFQLPSAQASLLIAGKAEPLVITIAQNETGCAVQIGSCSAVRLDDGIFEQDLVLLLEQLKQCMTMQKRFTRDPVEIVCQPLVKWEHIAKIYNVFYGAGLKDITFRMTE